MRKVNDYSNRKSVFILSLHELLSNSCYTVNKDTKSERGNDEGSFITNSVMIYSRPPEKCRLAFISSSFQELHYSYNLDYIWSQFYPATAFRRFFFSSYAFIRITKYFIVLVRVRYREPGRPCDRGEPTVSSR